MAEIERRLQTDEQPAEMIPHFLRHNALDNGDREVDSPFTTDDAEVSRSSKCYLRLSTEAATGTMIA